MTTTQTSTDPPIPLPAIAELEGLLGRSLQGWEDKRPKWVSPSPEGTVEGAWFDSVEVARVIRVLRKMPHTKTRQWARKPFEPETWQVVWIIAPVFGWKNAANRRIVRMVWDEVPRKAGKSTLSARIALFLLTADGEEGPEVYAAATSERQARQVFDEAKVVALRSRALKGRSEVLTSLIRVPKTFGIFRVLSKIAEAAHGLNVSGAVIDEIHLHKKRDLIEAIETGTGAREQPLIFHITTAGSGDDTTPYGEKHNLAVKIAEGRAVQPSMWVCIWAADKTDDPFDEATWSGANPNFPISPSREYMQEKADLARSDPTFLPSFLRLHLNIRGGLSGEKWPGATIWGDKGNAGLLIEDKLKGQPAWGGLVAATATDFTAICWVFRNPEGEGWWALWRHFIPRGFLPQLDARTNGSATVWASQGRLNATDGNQIDVPLHVQTLRDDANRFDVRELAYDPNGTIGIVQPLIEDRVVDVIPTYATTPGSSLIDMERMLRLGELNHGGDPFTAWQVENLVVKETPGGVLKIDRDASFDRVYSFAALEMAMRRALVAEKPRRSAYEQRGLLEV